MPECFPHLETFKKNIGKLNSLKSVHLKKKIKKNPDRPTQFFAFYGRSSEGNITIFFFLA